jgi:hypothetical protein
LSLAPGALEEGNGSRRSCKMMKSAAFRKSLPTTWMGMKEKNFQRSFGNVKLTLLCGFVTVLVLRGTVGVGNLLNSFVREEAPQLSTDGGKNHEHMRTLAQVCAISLSGQPLILIYHKWK